MSTSAEIHAKFFPPTRPIVRGIIPPLPVPWQRFLAPPPTEEAVTAAGTRSWTEARREAHRLTILAIYHEGFEHGRGKLRMSLYGSKTADEIILAICRRREVQGPDLHGHSTTKRLVEARREIANELRRQFGMSSTEIGHKLNRDHTTVLHLLGLTKRAREHLREGLRDLC